MSGFKFDLDKELAGVQRQRQARPEPRPSQRQAQGNQGGQSKQATSTPVTTTKPESKPQEPVKATVEPEGFDHSHEIDTSGSNKASEATKPKPVQSDETADWKNFRQLYGVFEHVGGDRPIGLNPNIQRSSVSGLPRQLLEAVKASLKSKYAGAVLIFPWGEHKIADNNKVFTANSTLMRYLMFDSFRDSEGSQLQYAKQWLVLSHPRIFDRDFNIGAHMNPNSDELDIYAMVYVAQAHGANEPLAQSAGQNNAGHAEILDKFDMFGMSMRFVLDKLAQQERAFDAFAERNTMLQTVLLLDRMGLLKGGLPKDTGDFVRVLEESRDSLGQTSEIIDAHINAEKERDKRLSREARMQERQQQRRKE